MAANPKNPLDDMDNDLARQEKRTQVPWGLITAIIFLICLGLIMWWFFA